jgi:hypothetical protein
MTGGRAGVSGKEGSDWGGVLSPMKGVLWEILNQVQDDGEGDSA